MVTRTTERRPGLLKTALGVAALVAGVGALAASLLDAPAAGSVRVYDDQRLPVQRAVLRTDADIAEAPGCPVEGYAGRMSETTVETC